MIADYIAYAVSNLFNRKMRSWLTLMGIFIGIAAIVALISLGQGLKFAVTAQFEELGTDKIMVLPGESVGSLGISAESSKLTEKEVRIIERTPGVTAVNEMQYGLGKVEFNDRNIFTFVVGASLETKKMALLTKMSSFRAIEGRMIRQGDSKKAQIGYLLAESDSYFGKKLKVGNKILIEGGEFEVVGVTSEIGNPQDDSQIIISIEDNDELFKKNGKYDALYVGVADSSQVDIVAGQIKKEIRKSRGQKEGEEDFIVQTMQELLESFSAILNIITAVLIGIAAISLLVGAVGIMNTMYTAVLERTNEIGIMKAIGAKNSDILTIFLIESGLLGLVGGIIGIAIGVALGWAAAFIAGQALQTTLIKAYFPWYLIAGSLFFSLAVGMLSGILPAIQASKLKPVDSLRYE